jgi:hypothetical protein
MLPLPEESEPVGDAYRSQCTAGGVPTGCGVGAMTGWLEVGGALVTGSCVITGVGVTGCEEGLGAGVVVR